MKLPHFRLASFMVFVAVIALEGMAMRVSFGHPPFDGMVLGSLPLVSLLDFGLILSRQPGESRRFFLGFEAFGVLAIALYLSGSWFYSRELSQFLKVQLADRYVALVGLPLNTVRIVGLYLLVAAILALPQVGFAVLGGFVCRYFRAAELSDRTLP